MLASAGRRAALQAALGDLRSWDDLLGDLEWREAGGWLHWGKNMAGQCLALVAIVRTVLAAFNLATGRRPNRDTLTTGAMVLHSLLTAIGFGDDGDERWLHPGGDEEHSLGKAGKGSSTGLSWLYLLVIDPLSLAVVAVLVGMGLRGLVTNARKLSTVLGWETASSIYGKANEKASRPWTTHG